MRRLRFAVLAAMTSLIAGCALLIDLGDEPKLLPHEAGPAETSVVTHADGGADAEAGPIDRPETGAPDSGVDAAPVNVCGLPDSAKKSCATCIHTTQCCDISKTCANTPNCVAGLDCVKHCVVDLACISDCRTNFPEVTDLTDCSAFNCDDCTPKTECRRLGQCVFALDAKNIVRISTEAIILNVDEDACLKQRVNIVENGDSDAGPCYIGIDAGNP